MYDSTRVTMGWVSRRSYGVVARTKIEKLHHLEERLPVKPALVFVNLFAQGSFFTIIVIMLDVLDATSAIVTAQSGTRQPG